MQAVHQIYKKIYECKHVEYLFSSTHCFVKFLELNTQLLNVVHQDTGCFSLLTPDIKFFDNFLSILKQHILHSLQRLRNNIKEPEESKAL